MVRNGGASGGRCFVGVAGPSSSAGKAVIALWIAASVAAIGLVLAWPLGTYTVSLALFGLAHVAYEFRYVDQRFGKPLFGAVRTLIGLLVLVAVSRTAGVLGAPKAWTSPLEIGLVIALAGTPIVLFPAMTFRQKIPAVLGAGVLALTSVVFPTVLMSVLAILHNLTPMGFLAEVLEGPGRRRYLLLAAVLMFGVPVLIASGVLQPWILGNPDISPITPGPLAAHLQAYLAKDWHSQPWATHLFQAAVYGQLVHYVCTIVLLPRIGRDLPSQPSLRWPSPTAFAGAVAVGTVLLMIGYWTDFSGARQVYGIAAAMHAWIEIPLLLAVAGGWNREMRGFVVA